MAPVARELAPEMGVIEALQTASTLEGQVDELMRVMEKRAKLPAVIVGHSWGAWLSFIVAARFPQLVSKLILVGSGGFLDKHGAETEKTRMSRLTAAEKAEIQGIREKKFGAGFSQAHTAFERIGEIYSRADSFEPLPEDDAEIELNPDIYESVWRDAQDLRKKGKLLELGEHIKCPVTALHGDYDPHPAEGVSAPLSAVLKDFTFILLEKCGHKPWTERHARETFFKSLREELSQALKA
jgi:pimeloyl-ACP methyl ester carboxylesterase